MEIPTKDKTRQFYPTKGDLSQTVAMKEQEAKLWDQATDIFTGFTDAMMVKYANKLEEDGKKQAMIDAYNNSKEGKKQPIEHKGLTTFSRGYEEMSKKIYANQLKLETDQTINNFAIEYEADPIEFGRQIQMYMQETEDSIPEEMRESWRQEVVGNSTVALNRLREQHEKKMREQFAGSFVNTINVLDKQGQEYADARVDGMIDKNINEFETMVDQAVLDEIMTPAQGEKAKLSHRATIGEIYIMSEFKDVLDTGDLSGAIQYAENFGNSKPAEEDPWQYDVNERDAIYSKMISAIKAKQTAMKSKSSGMKSVNNRKLKDATKILENGGEITNGAELDTIDIDSAGVEQVENYRLAKTYQPYVNNFNRQTLFAQEAEINRLKGIKTRTPDEQYILESYERNYEKNQTEIEKDPVSHYFNKKESDTFKPFDMSNVSNSFKSRIPVATAIKDDFGRQPQYLTEGEATAIADRFTGENGNYANMVAFAQETVSAIGEDAKYVFRQLTEKKAFELSMIGELMNRGDAVSVETALKIADGMSIMYGPGKQEKVVPSDFNMQFNAIVGNVFDSIPPDHRNSYAESVKALVAKDIYDRGLAGDPDANYDEILATSIQGVIGGEMLTVKDHKVMPPWRGATIDDLEDRIKSVITLDPEQFEGLSKNAYNTLKAEFQKDLNKSWGFFGDTTSLQYRSAGSGEYFILNAEGKPFRKENGEVFLLKITE